VKKKGSFYRRRACTQVLFLRIAELGFFHFLQIVTRLAGTFHRRSSRLLKTSFFRQVRELKIQRKNPGSALRIWIVISMYFPPTKSKTKVHKNYYNNNNKEPQLCNTTLRVPKT
jgi:hypothetical protein